MSTLQQLYDQHPEWRNLELVLYNTNGSYDFVGSRVRVYEGEYFEDTVQNCIEGQGQKVLVFDNS